MITKIIVLLNEFAEWEGAFFLPYNSICCFNFLVAQS